MMLGRGTGAMVCLLVLETTLGCGATTDGARATETVGSSGASGSGSGGSSGAGASGGSDGGIDTCVPSCKDGVATVCALEGPKLEPCDALQGMSCAGNACVGPCDKTALGKTNVGCDFYPTITSNAVFNGFRFAVAVASASDEPATVTITRGEATYAEESLPAGGATVISLPWVPELKGKPASALEPPPSGPSVSVADGAYRLRSTEPVVAYQFNPLEYELVPAPADCPVLSPDGRCFSYSNDASLLLPINALTDDYFVLGWPSLGTFSGFVTVTATDDDTQVEFLGSAAQRLQGGVSIASPPKLARGDVLQIFSKPGPAPNGEDSVPWGPDLSGLRVRASKPVQVVAGHAATTLPSTDVCCLDHMEESVLPARTLGKDYFVTRPAASSSLAPYTVKILALEPDTHVGFSPESAAAPLTLAAESVQLLSLNHDVRITADKAIAVTQYLHSQDAAGNIGDPAQSAAIPSDQYRTSYVFFTPTTFAQSYVSIVAPAGASVTLDGVAVGDFIPIGTTGFGVAQRELEKTPVHRVQGDEPVGITVHGYGDYSSYMYPGGLDLHGITVPPEPPH